jgi:hypothetical protein
VEKWKKAVEQVSLKMQRIRKKIKPTDLKFNTGIYVYFGFFFTDRTNFFINSVADVLYEKRINNYDVIS